MSTQDILDAQATAKALIPLAQAEIASTEAFLAEMTVYAYGTGGYVLVGPEDALIVRGPIGQPVLAPCSIDTLRRGTVFVTQKMVEASLSKWNLDHAEVEHVRWSVKVEVAKAYLRRLKQRLAGLERDARADPQADAHL